MGWMIGMTPHNSLTMQLSAIQLVVAQGSSLISLSFYSFYNFMSIWVFLECSNDQTTSQKYFKWAVFRLHVVATGLLCI